MESPGPVVALVVGVAAWPCAVYGDAFDMTDGTVVQALVETSDFWGVEVLEADGDAASGGSGNSGDAVCVGERCGEGLFYENVDAGLEQGDRHVGVEVNGCGDDG